MKNYKRGRGFAFASAALAAGLSLLLVKDASAIGQSAVVTLTFPVGARPTAMGEAFTGLANDANAIFYNPAGLGQSPLTLSWKAHKTDSAFTAVAARSAAAFGARNYVWAGTGGGVMRFNGKIWETGEVYLPEGDESLRAIALKYFNTDDKTTIDNAVWEIRRENKLGMKRYEQLVLLLESRAELFKNNSATKAAAETIVETVPEAVAETAPEPAAEAVSEETAAEAAPETATEYIEEDTAKEDGPIVQIPSPAEPSPAEPVTEAVTETAANADAAEAEFDPRAYAKMIMLLPSYEQVSGHLQEKVLPQSIPAQARADLANSIVTALDIEDRSLGQLTEIKIPFAIAARDTVTALALDASERLWVGTVSGLWRYHNGKWQHFGESDGLPSSRITAVSVSPSGDAAVATEKGLAVLKDTEWSVFTSENGLPDSYVTSAAYTGNGHLYAGTPKGLARLADGSVTVFDTSSGLLSLGVTALFADSKGQIWIGGENGITIYSGTRNWKRYKFPGSIVYSFAEQSNGAMWIGTNKGIITHKSGKEKTGEDGKTASTPEWKTYHSKNALKNDNIRAMSACGKDMWIATDGAMHQYAYAETQALLFYEQLMPAFKMSDLWHGFPAIVIPTEDWGTLGFSMNFINMGDNERWDELENYLGRSRSWEGVFGISYGFPIKEDLSLGLSAKYVVSVLDPSVGGWGQTFAIDAGILKRNLFIEKFDVGFMLQNMGPKIYYMTPEEADPIPFSLRLGLAYKPVQTPFHELTLVGDFYREVVKNYYDKGPDPFWVAIWTGMLNNKESSTKEEWQEINFSLGMEYTYADFMALRTGFLGDYLGERFELSIGLGVKYANMNFDFSYIFSPEGFMRGMFKDGSSGARDGQWRISFLFGL